MIKTSETCPNTEFGLMKSLSAESEISSLEDNCWLNKHVRSILWTACPKVVDADPNNRSEFARSVICSILYILISKMFKSFPTGEKYTFLVRSICKLNTRLLKCESNSQIMEYVSFFTAQDVWEVVDSTREPPLRPKHVLLGDVLYTGYLKRFIKISKMRKDYVLVISLLQSKRLWPKIPLDKIQATLASNRDNLCVNEVPVLIPEIKFWIYKIVENLAERGRGKVKPTSFTPSMSACLQKKRHEGGCGNLFEPFKLKSYLERKKEYGFSPLTGRVYPLHPHQLYAEFEEHRKAELMSCKLQASNVAKYLNETELKLVFEPGKARIIGVECGIHSSYIQVMQGMMLDLWKLSEHSTMVTDLDEKILSKINNSSLPFCLSADYKNATDTMNSAACAYGIDAYLSVMDYSNCGMDRVDLIREFIDCILIYPNIIYDIDPYSLLKVGHALGIDNGLQKNGQRMGNRKSFPILCVVNAAAFYAALDEFMARADLPNKTAVIVRTSIINTLMINGDDKSALVPETFYEVWKPYVENIGWKLSPGKSYFSKNFLQINSRNYVRTMVPLSKDEPNNYKNKFKRIGYLNMKIVTGLNLKGSGEADADPEQLGRDLTEMHHLCPFSGPAIAKCMARFQRSRPQQWFKDLNWFLPVHLGGLGLGVEVCDKEDIVITKSQRKLASLMLSDPQRHITSKILDEMVKWLRLSKEERNAEEAPIRQVIEQQLKEIVPRVRFVDCNWIPEYHPYVSPDQEIKSSQYLRKLMKRIDRNLVDDYGFVVDIGPFERIGMMSDLIKQDEDKGIRPLDPILVPETTELDNTFIAKLAMIVRWNIVDKPLEKFCKKIANYTKDWRSHRPMKLKKLFLNFTPKLVGPPTFEFPQTHNFDTFKLIDHRPTTNWLTEEEYITLPRIKDLKDRYAPEDFQYDVMGELFEKFEETEHAQRREKLLSEYHPKYWDESMLNKNNKEDAKIISYNDWIRRLHRDSCSDNEATKIKAKAKLVVARQQLLKPIHLV